MKKRALSVLTMAVMLLTLLPGLALAEDVSQAHCSCVSLCTEGDIKFNCPVCGAVGADLSTACKPVQSDPEPDPEPTIRTVKAITTPLSFGSGTEDVSGDGYSWVKNTKTLTLSGIRLSAADSRSTLTIEAGSTVEVAPGTVNEITNTSDGAGVLITGSSERAATFLGTGSLTVCSQGDGIVATGLCQIDISGGVALTVTAGENGIYSLLDRVCIKDTAQVTVRAEAGNGITCAFGGDQLSPATIPFAMSGSPVVEVYAGADGIQAIDGVAVTGGTLTVSAAGNGIYSDYDAAFENCVLHFPASGTGNGFVSEGDTVLQNVTVTAACGGTALSANGTITMKNCSADLASSGSGYTLFANGLTMDGGTLTAGGTGGGISVEYATSELKNAIVTVNARQGLRAKNLSLINTELCIGTTGQASLGAGQSWTLDRQSVLTNSGYLENGGSLTGAGAFVNDGVYFHRADAGLCLTGALTSGGGGRVICPLKADATQFEGLGTITCYLTEVRDYTQLPAPRDEGGFIWDAQAKVLTLSGVHLEADGAFALKVPDGTAIRLEGAPSSISNASDQGVGIQMEGVVSLTGEHGLSVSANIPIQGAEFLTVYDTVLQLEGNAGIAVQTLEAGNTALSIRSVNIPCISAAQQVKLVNCSLDLMGLNSGVIAVAEQAGKLPVEQLNLIPQGGFSVTAQGGAVTLVDQANQIIQTLLSKNRGACLEVCFDSQGGTPCPTRELLEDEAIWLPTPARQDYIFLGWYTADGTKLVGETATFTRDTTLYAHWRSEYAGSSGSGGGSSSTTHKNPDGSTTLTKPDGTVVETTKGKDGSQTVVETRKDGSVKQTATTAEGVKAESETTTGGQYTAQVTIPETAAKDDKTPVVLPILPVTAEQATEKAPVITITAPKDKTVQVEVPMTGVKPGTVAVRVLPDGTEEIVRTCVPTEQGLTLAVTGETTLKMVDNTKTFADVAANNWAADSISFVTARALFNGTGQGTFSPDLPMTRAMLMTVLARTDGQDTTISGGKWYDVGMQWAVEQSISDGTNPDGFLTREQLATMLYRYAGSPATTGTLDGFTDAAAAGSYAVDALKWAVEQGIITGKGGGVLDPKGSATRAEVSAMLMRYLE